MLHDAGNISYSKSLIINLNTFFYIITIINKTVQYIRVIIHHFISVPKETKFIYYYYFFAQKNCKPCFQSLQLSLFMYLQNHIQSFISPSISFLSYHFKLTFHGNHSCKIRSGCKYPPVSSTHAFPLLACLLRLCPRPISNSQLHALLHFHLCPIYLVVFKGSYYFRRDISS